MAIPDPITLLVCDRAALDAQGKVSLVGLFDVIWTAALPSLHAELTVFTQVRFHEPGATRVVLEAPDGTPLAVGDGCRATAPGKTQAISTFTNLTLPVAGDYVVRLIASEGTLATTSFAVRSRQ